MTNFTTELKQWLSDKKSRYISHRKINPRTVKRELSEITWWYTTVCDGVEEVVDYETLLKCIDEFGEELRAKHSEIK